MARIKIDKAKKVTKGIRLESFFELKRPTKIIGAIIAVPVKLVLANKTKCSVLTIEKIRARTAKTKMLINGLPERCTLFAHGARPAVGVPMERRNSASAT